MIWANGNTQTFNNVEPDRVILLKENRSKITTLFGDDPDPQAIIGTTQDDRLSGTVDNDQIDGRGGDDRLKGLNGDDTLVGRAGDDVLVGGKGNDILNGGPGRDRYVFTSPNQGRDRIMSFAGDLDDILISQKGFKSGLTLGKLAANRFVLGNRARDSGDRFIYHRNRGQLFFDPDGNGTQNARLLATLDESPMLGANHIVVF